MLSPADRDRVERGENAYQAVQVKCSRGIIDLHEGLGEAGTTDGEGSWNPLPEYGHALAKVVCQPRQCVYFQRFESGSDPEKHLEIQRAERYRADDRRWDKRKMVLTVLLSATVSVFASIVATQVAPPVIKSWIDYFQALR
jgi:hypothetical protein